MLLGGRNYISQSGQPEDKRPVKAGDDSTTEENRRLD